MTLFEFSFFGFDITGTWYGFMYAIGFLTCYVFLKYRGPIEQKHLDDFLLFMFIGVVLGGRIGYVLLYDFGYFLDNPLKILEIWKGGMSFHGGTLGVIIALIVFAKKYTYKLFIISDALLAILPLALGLGRIGNYLNKELLGYFPYGGPLAIIQDGISYFPSPLLQAFLEGCVLLGIMQYAHRKMLQGQFPAGYMSALFLISYALLRIFAELFRLPDSHIGYLAGTHWLTLGMLYSVPMLIGGCIVFLWARQLAKN